MRISPKFSVHRGPSLLALAFLACASPVLAHPGGWGRPGWDGADPFGPFPEAPRRQVDRSREGKVDVSRFVADGAAADALGHGAIAVTSQSADHDYIGEGDRAVFEAAVVDRLVHAGYDTAQANAAGGQVAELHITRSTIDPGEPPHKPVSGEAAMEVGNRGTGYGLALNVDLSKPLPPLVATRLEVRIRDKASGKVLWEGRASVATREGDAKWPDQKIAARLSEALFDGFPHAGETLASAQ